MRVSLRKKSIWPLVAPLALCVQGCGGGGGSAGGSSGITPAPSPTATPAPSPSPTPAPSPGPAPTPTPTPTPTTVPATFAEYATSLYDVQPDLAGCKAGVLKASVKADLLTRLNAIRALHNLPAVTYSQAEDAAEQDSTLMMAANNALSHTPPATWLCYTSQGADASGKSNLHGGWGRGLGIITDDDVLGAWLREGGSASIGHRRWLLSPFLGQASYGRVIVQSPDGSRATASSLRVFGFATTPPVPSAAAIPDFVAYPYGDYPVRYFKVTDYLSFTALATKTGTFSGNEKVSYAGATVTVTGPGGAMTVTDVQSDNAGYGVANAISWRVTGLVAGQTYSVTIQGVTGAARTSYTYSFRII